jgi:4-hydroxy-2-oxoheptanedioate aldolase
MMRKNRVKEMWRAGQPVIVGWCSTADPYVTEIMARSGFDALVLDTQHGMTIGPERTASWLQIVGQTETTPIVRIAWNEPVLAQWALDAGAMGIIIPLVNTVEDARKAIGACRYPPIGYRSLGLNRAPLYAGADYFNEANNEVICLAMMETMEGIRNIEEIAKIPGCDGYFVGPSDLAVDMGLAPTSSPHTYGGEYAAAVQRVIDVARKNGQVAGAYVSTPDDAVYRWKQGFNLNPIGSDAGMLSSAVKSAVAQFRTGAGLKEDGSAGRQSSGGQDYV